MVDAPKKPQTTYFAWFASERDNICKKLGTKDLKVVGAKAGAMWKAMSDDQKKPFADEYNRSKAVYEKFMETDEGKKALEEQKAGRQEKKAAKVDKLVKTAVKSVEKDDKLKKPQTAYFLFLGDNRQRIVAEVKTGSPAVVSKKAGEMWNALSEAAKKPWLDKAKQQKEAYEAYLKTPEGAEALQAYKDATQVAKGEVRGFKAPEKKRKDEAEAESPPNKKARKSAVDSPPRVVTERKGTSGWERFTPREVNKSICMARTWAGGHGDQCGKTPQSESEFCLIHKEKWQAHGRVDGPIPEKKLQEFEKAKV